ncbi:hypothetical protein DFP72DRAFT_1017071 [Ephemerocybe angulata]|uniref:Uncharacterized protein n=1 Tax=Ephemerocybe angulata TaxID=980116 RepID=A0A8H6HI44_9AGAR|nr:hypothetical protein DFP72DRAFT_1017071 [Tulosesus angulatus]
MSTPTSSAQASTSSPVDLITPKNDRRILSVIVVLAIVGAFVIASIVWYTLRLKRRSKRPMSGGPFQGTSIWDKNHPASRITPFGAPSNAPSFDHRPGEDMRIAYRRPDGAWLFADSGAPFTPSGVSDLVNSPVSASSSQVFPFSPAYNPTSKKEQEAKLDSLKADKDGYFDYDSITPPPPAYQRHAKEVNPFL